MSLKERIGNPHIVVLGDVMLDRYTWGDVERISPEAPILVLASNHDEVRLGGAASVAGLLRHLDARVSIAGAIGDDAEGRVLTALLDESAIDRRMLVTCPDRPTTSKHRFLGRVERRAGQPILRVDRETSEPLPCDIDSRLEQLVVAQLSGADVLLISDYKKGVCSPRQLQAVIKAAGKREIPVLVDPARIADYTRYQGAEIVLPNRTEMEIVSGHRIDSPQAALEAGEMLCRKLGLPSLLVKLDSDGIAVINPGQGSGIVVPTTARCVSDVTGAGDMVLAIAGLCRSADMPLVEIATWANVAAGLEVEHVGVVPIGWSEIQQYRDATKRSHEKLVSVERLVALAEGYRRDGQTIVFTNGCFDLLHVGHVTYLEEAAKLGAVLVVAINSDSSVRRIKGDSRPVIRQEDRATMLAALSCVGHVVIFDEDTPHFLLQSIRPEVLVKGGTYSVDGVVGREVVDAYGGRVCVVSHFPGVSTTKLMASIKESLCT